MTPRRLALVAGGLLVALVTATPLSAAEPPPAGARIKALVGGRLIDGFGGPPLPDSVIVIDGDKILAVGRRGEVTIPEEAEIVSTEGMSVMPGLWDMHVHLMIVGHGNYQHWDATYPAQFRTTIMPAAAEQLLLAGVTSARDLGAPLEDILAIRKAIRSGTLAGPNLYVSGPFLQHEPYPGTELFRWGIHGVADARAKVKKLAEAGVDVIKLIDQDQMKMEEVEAIVDEAHQRKLPVVAHAHRPEEIRRAIAAGADCLEHTGLATMPEYPEDVYRAMVSRAATLAWTPTVTPLLLYEYTRDDFSERLDDPDWHRGLPPEIVADVARSLAQPERLEYFQLVPRRHPTLARKFAQLRSSGVTMLIGTDSGVPLTFHSDSTWRELDTWVREFGVAPMEALRAATYWPAWHLKVLERTGTVSPGKDADIIAVRGDVLRHIDLLQNVDLVIKGGVRYR